MEKQITETMELIDDSIEESLQYSIQETTIEEPIENEAIEKMINELQEKLKEHRIILLEALETSERLNNLQKETPLTCYETSSEDDCINVSGIIAIIALIVMMIQMFLWIKEIREKIE